MSSNIVLASLLSLLLLFSTAYSAAGDDWQYSATAVSEEHVPVEKRPSYLRSSHKQNNLALDGVSYADSSHVLRTDDEDIEFFESQPSVGILPEPLSVSGELSTWTNVIGSGSTTTHLTDSKTDITNKLPHWWKQAAAAILIVIGLVEVFFGYRLFTATMFIYGFVVVAGPVWFTFWFYVDLSNMSEIMRHCICIGVAAIGGILGGTLLVCVSVAAIFALGAGLGVVIAFILNAAVYSHFNLSPDMANVPLIASAVGLGIIFGVIALCVRKIFIVLATSVIGAFAVVYGASLYHKDFDFISIAKDVARDERDYPKFVYGYLAGFLFLAVLGIIVQFTVTAKGMRSKGRQVDDAYQELEVALTRIMGNHSKSRKKKRRKKKKRSRRNKAAALLADYEPGGAYYDHYYDDYTDYGYDDYDDSHSYYDGYGYDRASAYSRPTSRRSSMYHDDDGMTAYSMRSGRKKSYTGGFF